MRCPSIGEVRKTLEEISHEETVFYIEKEWSRSLQERDRKIT